MNAGFAQLKEGVTLLVKETGGKHLVETGAIPPGRSAIVGFDVPGEDGHPIGRFVGYLHLFGDTTAEQFVQAMEQDGYGKGCVE